MLMLTGTAILFNLQVVGVLRIDLRSRSYDNALTIGLPLCTKGILSKKSISLLSWNRLNENMPLIHKNDHCRLHLYNKMDFGNCVEALNSIAIQFDAKRDSPAESLDDGIKSAFSFMNRDKSNSLAKIDDNRAHDVKLRVSFMGDSRIHQMYLNFIMQVKNFGFPFLLITTF